MFFQKDVHVFLPLSREAVGSAVTLRKSFFCVSDASILFPFFDTSGAFEIAGLRLYKWKKREKNKSVKKTLYFPLSFSFYNNLIRKIKNLLLFLRVFIYDNK